jgi:hypothetical protein
MTEMQHLLLLLQVHLHPLLPRRQHPRLRRRQPRPRLLVKVSFCIFSSSSVLFGRSVASECVCVCVCELVSLWVCCVYLCGSGPGIFVVYVRRLGVKKKRVLLARARSLNTANPNKSVGTQNDLDHQSPHTTRTSPSQSGYPLLFDIHSLSQP